MRYIYLAILITLIYFGSPLIQHFFYNFSAWSFKIYMNGLAVGLFTLAVLSITAITLNAFKISVWGGNDND